jgi:hypothetical protein
LSHWRVFRGNNLHGAVIYSNNNVFFWNTCGRPYLRLLLGRCHSFQKYVHGGWISLFIFSYQFCL